MVYSLSYLLIKVVSFFGKLLTSWKSLTYCLDYSVNLEYPGYLDYPVRPSSQVAVGIKATGLSIKTNFIW
jgi:hypothetical protein